MKKLTIVLSLLIMFSGIYAQDVAGFVELMKMDLKTKKLAIISEGMQLTEDEGQKFWPIYKEFDEEMDKLFDSNLTNIKDFAENFEKMTDDKAKEIGETALEMDKKRIEVEEKYLEKISEELSPIIAVRFLQISRQINFLIRLQINSELPLIQKPVEEKKTM